MTSDDERFEDADSDTPQVDQWELERAQKVQEAIFSTPDEAKVIDTIAEIRGWFSPRPDSIFYPIIQDYVDEKINLDEAQTKIRECIDKAATSNTEDDEIDTMDLWYSILHSAKRISFRDPKPHGNLVTLLQALKSKTHSTLDELPSFNMAVREVSNDQPGVGAGFSIPETHAWTNFNYFLARLTQADVMDFWIYIIWAMRPALEDVLKDDGPDDAHVPATVVQKYDARVPAASVWILAMGKEIYNKEEDLTPKNANEGNSARGGERWKGKAEFSKERWALWKQRFGEISELEEVAEETRKIAKEAFEIMEKV